MQASRQNLEGAEAHLNELAVMVGMVGVVGALCSIFGEQWQHIKELSNAPTMAGSTRTVLII